MNTGKTGTFEILAKSRKSRARTGIIKTACGAIQTPCFVPDATWGAVRHISMEELSRTGLQIVLGSIYHLWVRPGVEIIKKLGGFSKFIGWDGPVLTDSGGWQIFSLVHKNKMGKISEEGVLFNDHFSGEKHFFTPEISIKTQLAVGSDLLMALDYPVEPEASLGMNNYSVSLTTKWAKRGLDCFLGDESSRGKILMAIIQGGGDKKMRKKSFNELENLSRFAGYGFGGILGGKNDLEMFDFVAKMIPNDRIRYVMGGAKPEQIVEMVALGWDLFDCVIPTRNARHGLAYTFADKDNLKFEEVKIWQERYKTDKGPIERGCDCFACQNYSRAYIRHLLKCKEPFGQRLMTIHNLRFYARLMKILCGKIKRGQF